MRQLGFKKITPSNCLEPDPVITTFKKVSPNGNTHPLTLNDYLGSILSFGLNESVPIEVQSLFEVARGAMVYDYFFYPLFTLAAEQLFRVVEAALLQKCKTLDVPKNVATFEKRINWLVEKGIITKHQAERFHVARRLRNEASHPKSQCILTPFMAIDLLQKVAGQINYLFESA